jgi:hypothetical protein
MSVIPIPDAPLCLPWVISEPRWTIMMAVAVGFAGAGNGCGAPAIRAAIGVLP